jgi:hypothetical protein
MYECILRIALAIPSLDAAHGQPAAIAHHLTSPPQIAL